MPSLHECSRRTATRAALSQRILSQKALGYNAASRSVGAGARAASCPGPAGRATLLVRSGLYQPTAVPRNGQDRGSEHHVGAERFVDEPVNGDYEQMNGALMDHQYRHNRDEHVSCSDEQRENRDGLPFAAGQAGSCNDDRQWHENQRDEYRDQCIGHGEHDRGRRYRGLKSMVPVFEEGLDVAKGPAEPLLEQSPDSHGRFGPCDGEVLLDDAVPESLKGQGQVSVFGKRVMGVAASLGRALPGAMLHRRRELWRSLP